MDDTDEIESEDEGDCVATPVPLAAHRPRSHQRFTVTGYAGVWKLMADISGAKEFRDITLSRGRHRILATLGERLVELEYSDSGGGSESVSEI